MSQTINGSLPTGETLTLKVRTTTANSSPVATAVGVEDESLAGLYSFEINYDGSGQHRLEVVNDDDVQLGQWLVVLAGADGQTELMDSGSSVLVSVNSSAEFGVSAANDNSMLVVLIGDPSSSSTGNTSQISMLVMNGNDPVVDGTATCTLYNERMQALTGVANPVVLSHVTEGAWTGTIGADLVWPKSRKGFAVLSVTTGGASAVRTLSVLYREGTGVQC